MRDMRKVKNRQIFELDNKQMIFVFAGLIVICLFVFTAGVMVGSRSTRNRMVAQNVDNSYRAKIKAPSLLEEKKANDKREPQKEATTGESAPSTIEELLEPAIAAETPTPPAVHAKTTEAVKVARKETPKESSKVAPEAKKDEWFIQVASFQKADEAEALAGKLKAKNYSAIIVKADLKDRGIWYRVRLGPFDKLDKAKSFALDFEKKEKLKTYIPAN